MMVLATSAYDRSDGNQSITLRFPPPHEAVVHRQGGYIEGGREHARSRGCCYIFIMFVLIGRAFTILFSKPPLEFIII